jgi:hypothetical protein
VSTKVDVAQVIRASRVFGETRKETHLSLTSTYPMWILATGVSECDKNFSVFSELRLAAFVQKNLKNWRKLPNNFLQIQKKVSNIFLQNRRKLLRKCLQTWVFYGLRENSLISSPNLEKIDLPNFSNPEKAPAKIFQSREGDLSIPLPSRRSCKGLKKFHVFSSNEINNAGRLYVTCEAKKNYALFLYLKVNLLCIHL